MSSKILTIEEAEAMGGLAFMYIYEDGDSIPGFVAKFNREDGLSCHTLASETIRDGWENPSPRVFKDGTWCIISVRDINDALSVLTKIKRTGEYRIGSDDNLYRGQPICQF